MNKRLYSMSDGIEFDLESCRFKEFAADMEPQALIDQMSAPVSVILQITRRCNLNCVFCSEPEQIPDTSLEDLKTINNNLKGTHRVFLSGGEPLIRKDFNRVLDIFCENYILGVPTNAMISDSMLLEFKEKVSFVNVGLDGPRAVTSRMRGDFDAIIDGIGKFKAAGIPVSLTSVVLRSTSDTVLYTCQLADALGAKKLKLVLPIRKGNAVALDDNEYMSHEECIPLFERIVEAKEKCGWNTKITFSTWTPETEGYSILSYPDGRTFAWPVLDAEDKVLYVGNIIHESIQNIWDRYPYKINHLRKYLGDSVFVS